MKSLQDYVNFLKENKLDFDVKYYETDVVPLLKQFGYEDPLSMSTDAVVGALQAIKVILDSITDHDSKPIISRMNNWAVELTR